MYQNLMEEAVTPESCRKAIGAVVGNDGAPGIDRMRAADLEKHLEAHWERIRAKLLAGIYVPTPVRRMEIKKLSGGVRMRNARRRARNPDGVGSVRPAVAVACPASRILGSSA
jgi:hypothetical protein